MKPFSKANHKPGIEKSRWPEGSIQYTISEAVYASLLEISQVAHMAVNRLSPLRERERNPKVQYHWASATDEIKEFRTRYKVIVRDDLLRLGKFKRHPKPYDVEAKVDNPTQEFRRAVLGQVYWLRQKLEAFAPAWGLKDEELDKFITTLNNVYIQQNKDLEEFLSYYEVTPILTREMFEG